MAALDDILKLTDRVEACLDDGDWAAAAELNAERQTLLTGLFGRVQVTGHLVDLFLVHTCTVLVSFSNGIIIYRQQLLQ